MSANYPGTTVDYYEGKAKLMGMTITVTDLPGTYSLAGNTDEERVATDLLLEKRPHTVIAVLDATRLERNLAFLFELIESGYNTIVSLNMYDLLRKAKLTIDVERLERILTMPIVPTVATKGEGVDTLLFTALQIRHRSGFRVRYDSHIEEMIDRLSKMLREEDWGVFPLRGVALRLLSGDDRVSQKASPEVVRTATAMREAFRKQHGEDIIVHIQRDRFGEAGRVTREVLKTETGVPAKKRSISDLTLTPVTGIPILIGVLALVFVSLVFLGGAIEGVLVEAWESAARGFFDDVKSGLDSGIGQGMVEGVYISIVAMLALVVPYILLFYIMLSVLEDTGYLVRVVSLLDGVMHRLGLHGRAVLPMIVGFGCNVPAILATRAMGSRRERLILAVLITIAVPCSAQTAIIVGSVGHYAGALWALAIFAILMAMLLVLGLTLHRVIRFEPTGLAIEVPDLRLPNVKQTWIKTYFRVKEFLTIAFPLLLVGSIVLEALLAAGALDKFEELAAPFMTAVLGLPAATAIALVFGILRKEMALQMLMVLYSTSNLALVLSSEEMFVFALVMAVFMPCLAAVAVLVKEFGVKSALVVSAASISLAFVLGAAAKLILGA